MFRKQVESSKYELCIIIIYRGSHGFHSDSHATVCGNLSNGSSIAFAPKIFSAHAEMNQME